MEQAKYGYGSTLFNTERLVELMSTFTKTKRMTLIDTK